MQKSPFTTPIRLVAAALLLPGVLLAQQTPAATTTPQTTAPKSPATAATKKTTATAKPAPLTLKTDKDKASYAFGMNFGSRWREQGIPVDPALVARGLKDAMSGGKTLMTEDEMKTVLTQLQTDFRKQMQA